MLVRVVATVAALAGLTVPSLASADSAPVVRTPGVASDVQSDGCLTTIDRQSAYKAASVGTAIEIGRQALNESKEDPTVNITGSTGGGPITAYKVEVELSFRRWTVLESKPGEITENASSWSGSFSVDTFTKYGIGIFRFHVTTESAGKICLVTAYVKATHTSPFLTIAGAGASVAALLSLYLFASYFGGFGFLQEVSYSVKKKRRLFRPRIRPGPMLGGILAGGSALVLLQQSGRVYPETRLTLGAPLAGLLFSILYTSTIRKRETSRQRRRGDDYVDDDYGDDDYGDGEVDVADVGDEIPARTKKKSRRSSSRHPSERPAKGSDRKRPVAQRPRPAAYTPTPMPPPPPQPSAIPQPSDTRPSVPGHMSPGAFPGPAVPPTGPTGPGTTPLPPPPPPYLG